MPSNDAGGKLPLPASSSGRGGALFRGRSYNRLALLLLCVCGFLFYKKYHPVYIGGHLTDPPPPAYKELREYERTLPQHNFSLPFPEGRHGRYVRFSNQIRGLGWNNVLNEILLCGEVAHQSNRAYVFEEFGWKGDYYPWPWPTRVWPWQTRSDLWPRTPLNALLSGPLVGGSWETGDNAPRSVRIDYWEKVCPQNERVLIDSNVLKDPVRNAQGDVVFKHMVDVLNKEKGRCVEIVPNDSDGFPQTFDLWLIGDPRGVSMSKLFLNTPTSRLFGTSPLVAAQVARNEYLIHPKGPKNINAPRDPYERMMAVHIRRGDFGPACNDRALWASTYYQWNMWPELPDKFTVPPDSGDGKASDTAKAIYRKHCFPTEAELIEKIRAARKEYLAGGENRVLDVMYILTNAKKDWIDDFSWRLKKDGWGTVVTTKDLQLDSEGIDVAMSVDMELGRKAAVFIGNGWSSFTSNVVHRRLVDKREPVATRFW